MPRRLLNLLTALSLLLCGAVVVLWVLSYFGIPDLKWGNGRHSGFGWTLYDHELHAYNAMVYYTRCYGPMASVNGADSATSSRFLGVCVDRGHWEMVPDSDLAPYRCLTMVPFYWLVMPTLPMTVASLRSYGRTLRRRRQQPGLCVACGYDLTGNVSGVCSECGAHL